MLDWKEDRIAKARTLIRDLDEMRGSILALPSEKRGRARKVIDALTMMVIQDAGSSVLGGPASQPNREET